MLEQKIQEKKSQLLKEMRDSTMTSKQSKRVDISIDYEEPGVKLGDLDHAIETLKTQMHPDLNPVVSLNLNQTIENVDYDKLQESIERKSQSSHKLNSLMSKSSHKRVNIRNS